MGLLVGFRATNVGVCAIFYKVVSGVSVTEAHFKVFATLFAGEKDQQIRADAVVFVLVDSGGYCKLALLDVAVQVSLVLFSLCV